MNFEKSLERLREIINILEKGDATLSQSLDLYKEAVELSVSCKKELEDAKLQIEIIENINKDNEV